MPSIFLYLGIDVYRLFFSTEFYEVCVNTVISVLSFFYFIYYTVLDIQSVIPTYLLVFDFSDLFNTDFEGVVAGIGDCVEFGDQDLFIVNDCYNSLLVNKSSTLAFSLNLSLGAFYIRRL